MSRTQIAVTSLLVATVLACAADDGASGISAPHSAALAKAPPVSDPTATFFFPIDDASLSLKSDGRFVSGASSAYAHGACGVDAKIFFGSEASGSGDAIMQTNNPRFSDRKCPFYPRTMTLAYSDGVNETIPVFMNVRQVQNTVVAIPIGTTVMRSFAVNPTQTTRCDQLLWSSERQGVPVPADSVLVTRVAADTWRVQTQAPPNNRAYCNTLGQSFNMSVDFTIVSSHALPNGA